MTLVYLVNRGLDDCMTSHIFCGLGQRPDRQDRPFGSVARISGVQCAHTGRRNGSPRGPGTGARLRTPAGI